VYGAFRRLVRDPSFSCLGARSAVARGTYRIGLYERMGSVASTETLAYDLATFTSDRAALGAGATTFVASFTEPLGVDEQEFERLVWMQLGALDRLDADRHAWDPSVSADPADTTFAFSFAERAYFVVGLHARSSRLARRFGWPTLVFNVHEQFRELRATGRFARMQSVIREREMRLQGSINPNLSDFGVHSEARQYSGRAVEDAWKCPFRHGSEEPG
jgi:hypothetical protein